MIETDAATKPSTALTPEKWADYLEGQTGAYRLIYHSPYVGGTQVSEPGGLVQCMASFAESVANGYLRQGNGRRMVVMSADEFKRVYPDHEDLLMPRPTEDPALRGLTPQPPGYLPMDGDHR